jgi:hypothetical protein
MIRTRPDPVSLERLRRFAHRLTLAAVLLWASAVAGVPVHATQLIDRVLAVVSGSIVTLSDARAAIDLGLVEAHGARDPVATALTWLIERTLILDEAIRYDPVEPDRAAVDGAVQAAQQRLGSAAAWGRTLDRLGLTDEAVRALIRDTLYAQQYVDRRFATPFPVTDDELRTYYERHRDGFVRSGQRVAFDVARDEVATQVQRERRAAARAEWVSRLRRRADVSELYLPAR